MEQRRLLWTAILCLVVLLQQFSPGFADCTVDDDEEAVIDGQKLETKLTKEIDEEDTEEDSVSKRWSFSGFSQMLFTGIKVGLKYGDELAALIDLTVNLPVAVAGCAGYYPIIEENWKLTQRLHAQYNNISDQIDKLFLDATILQCYAISTASMYKSVRKHLDNIAKELELLFTAMSPTFPIELKKSTDEIKKIVQKKNGTKEEMTANQVSQQFDSRLAATFDVVVSSLTLAIPGFKRLYKHAKGSAIGYKIIEIEDNLKVKLKIKGSAYNYHELEGNRMMSSSKAKRIQRMKKLFTNPIRKYRFGHNLYSKVKWGLGKIFSIGSIAFNIWSAMNTLSVCKDQRTESNKAAAQMRYFIANATEYLENAKKAHQEGQEVWQEIKDIAWADNLIFALESVADMVSLPSFTEDTELSTLVLGSIKEYIDATNKTGTPLNTYNLLRRLDFGIHKVTLPIQCHQAEGAIFTYIKEQCTEGTNLFKDIYNTAMKKHKVELQQSDCLIKGGEDFISLKSMEDGWKTSVEENDDIKVRCVQNNMIVLNKVNSALRNGKTVNDAEKLAEEMFNPHWKDDIEVLLRTLPKPDAMNIPDKVKKYICLFKNLKNKMSDEKGAALVKNTYPYVTLKVYKDQDCSNFD